MTAVESTPPFTTSHLPAGKAPYEAMENPADAVSRIQYRRNVFRRREVEPTRQLELSGTFGLAAECDQDVVPIGSRALLMTFTDVGWNTDSGPAQL